MKRLLLPLALSGLLAGSAAAQGVRPSGPAGSSYRIGPRDQIQIRVDELPNLDSEQAVAEDGTIVLPIIGTVHAQGLSEDQLALRLRQRLESEGLRHPTVTVNVSAYRSRPVSILGAVANPGNHFIPGRTTLLEVLLDAGGLTPDHGPSIFVRRRAENGLSDRVEIPAYDLVTAGDPALNLPILPGDYIHVPPAGEVVIHLLGEIEKSGSLVFPANRRVTLLTAIAGAGGLLETAARKIRIKRHAATGELEEVVVDYRKILNGSEPDVELEDGDLIIVKESFF